MKQQAIAREAFLYLFLVVAVILVSLPLVWVVGGAFKTESEFLLDPGAWFPASFANLQNFLTLFVERNFAPYMWNSVIVSSVAVLANIVFGSMAGFALAKYSFRGRQAVFVMAIAAMTIPSVALFVPQFLVIVQLGLVNTLAGIVAPILAMPISVFIMRQYSYSVPDEVLEAARVDGANELRVFVQVYLPLVGPAIATVAIMAFLYSWNIFLWPLVVAQSSDVYTAPVGLAIASQAPNRTDYGVLLAGAIVVLLPVLILFLFLQRYFIRGAATSGLK